MRKEPCLLMQRKGNYLFMYMLIPSFNALCFESTEYEAQSADLEKELQDALTSRKDLESNNEGKFYIANILTAL